MAWDKIENEESYGSGNFIQGGAPERDKDGNVIAHTVASYLLQIREITVGETINEQDKFVVEFDVLEASPNALDKPGATVSLVEVNKVDKKTGKSTNGAAGRVKTFAQALFPDMVIDGAGIAAMGGPSEPCKGMLIRCRAKQGKSKAGGPVTNKDWDHVKKDEFTPETLAAVRVKAGLGPQLA